MVGLESEGELEKNSKEKRRVKKTSRYTSCGTSKYVEMENTKE